MLLASDHQLPARPRVHSWGVLSGRTLHGQSYISKRNGWGVLPGQTYISNGNGWGVLPGQTCEEHMRRTWLRSTPGPATRIQPPACYYYSLSLECTAGEYSPAGHTNQQTRYAWLGSTPWPDIHKQWKRLGSTPRPGTQTNDPDAHGWGVLPGQTYAKHKQ